MGTNQPPKLPPEQVIGPDENGIMTVIKYRFAEDGKRHKITTTIRFRELANAVLSKLAERRSWAKFRGAASEDDSQGHRTVVSTEEIILERARPPGVKTETLVPRDALLSLIQSKALMVCRTCGKRGDHWRHRCPFKDLAQPPDFNDKPSTSEPSAPTAGSGKGTYVPPNQRSVAGAADRGGSADMRRKNDVNPVRVTNLPEDMREPDLLELFRPFGAVSRVYVAVDKKTGISRGFGFLNFVNREDAQRSINKLNGYGYDNLILRVEWATLRAN